MDDFQPISQADPATVLLSFAAYLVLGLIPACVLSYIIYFLTTLPLRRNQRGQAFVDLLENSVAAGRAPEAVIVDVAGTRDLSFGVRFYLLATYIESGLNLGAALEKVPCFLPPQVVATLKVGERIGDYSKVLPACRHLLRDAISQVRSSINYLVLLAFVMTPFSILVPIVFRIKILPIYKFVFEGLLEGSELPAFSRFVFGGGTLITWIQVLLILLVWGATFAYIAGPRLSSWVNRISPGSADAIGLCMPWKRKRLQRDFSTTLSLLLDSGVPESESLRLAGEATANSVMRRRAERATALLSQGISLPEAVRVMDHHGEFQWRLRNGVQQQPGGFLRALKGWHEALDAKAFQLEQAFAQLITTSLVLVNGLLIGSIALAIFLTLVAIINSATLW